MPSKHRSRIAALLALVVSAGCSRGTPAPEKATVERAAAVDAARIRNADTEPGNWMTTGRTYSEQRFSPLKSIDDKNVAQLSLAWSYTLDTRRGQEATPLVIDGAMYFTTAWSKVVALNAATGAPLWTYDPKVPPEWAVNACCDVVNRGLAAWNGKVYLGTLDGRLIALDAATGKPVWSTLTIDPHYRYTITGAPRVVKGRVIIGNGGAEMSCRGYVSAYDAETGKMDWRFYIVPGDPSKPFENPALEKAAKTWTGEWWKYGGGGNAWDSIAYDPDLDLVYVGTGNGGPWNERIRSPRGGDNLYLGSVIALKPETGDLVWYYQETPGDMWDYTSTQHIILADITLDGKPRKVILHAPKNGFFYVIDRTNGELLSAKPFTFINWAKEVDIKTGRPVETAFARYKSANPPPLVPGPLGAHSWQPMSFDPLTGFVYFPVQDSGFLYKSPEHWEMHDLSPNYGIDVVAAEMPQEPRIKQAILASVKGRLAAWDPVAQKQVWAVPRTSAWNGGVLSTAGGLVFEGTAEGNFEAFRAATGDKLWSYFVQSGVIAAPITYTAKGEQYVAVLAGWGGVFALAPGQVALRPKPLMNVGRMLAFKIGGTASLPPAPQIVPPELNPPASTASRATIEKGNRLYQTYCAGCHGDAAVSGGILPDLRYSGTLANDQWYNIVLRGALETSGMVNFSKELNHEDAEAIRAFVIFRANQSVEQAKAAAAPSGAKKP
ncbi:MAG TPA: PQQ-dependent dehydrogenase, methanol/ethanol family [Candidatus Acidoferrales bacterium]|nr:PQQ-dependent dehydrogenase, methanol/ethanol family [Candidatus Acidoferrales bacterium]